MYLFEYLQTVVIEAIKNYCTHHPLRLIRAVILSPVTMQSPPNYQSNFRPPVAMVVNRMSVAQDHQKQGNDFHEGMQLYIYFH